MTNLIENTAFSKLGLTELDAYIQREARANGLTIPEAYLASVMETLAALQGHVRVLEMGLDDAERSIGRVVDA